MTIRKRLNNRTIIIYTVTRYMGLAVQLVQGILLAKFLGPAMFGIWGFLSLILQYLAYSNLGIQHSTTVELSNKGAIDTEDNNQLTANALGFSLVLLLILILLGLFIQATQPEFFKKYDVNQYALIVSIVAGLTHINTLMTSIYRAHGAIYRVAIYQFIDTAMPITVLWLASGERLIYLLLISMAVAEIIGLVIFFINMPWKFSIALNRSVLMHIIAIGLPLLVYNASFNMITMIGRTILSGFYSVETMGYYSFANSITNAALLGLRSVAFVLLPDVINRTRSELSDDQALAMADKSNNLFGTSAYLLAFALILILPVLFLYIPAYRPAQKTIGTLILAQAMLSASFGYNAAALARGYQLQVAKISIVAVVLVGLSCILFAYINLEFFWVAVAVWIGSTVFSFLQGKLSLQMLNHYTTLTDFLQNRLLMSGFLSTLLFIVFSSWLNVFICGLLSGLSFVLVNWANITQLTKLSYSYIRK